MTDRQRWATKTGLILALAGVASKARPYIVGARIMMIGLLLTVCALVAGAACG